MDRGLGNYYRGNNNARRDDRRYDNFYSNRDKRGGGNMRGNRSGGNRGSNRDRGFFDNQSHNAGQNVIAALQLQNQNLLSAYIRNQSQSRGNVFAQHPTPRSRGGGFRPGDKRRQETAAGSFHKRSRPNDRPSGSTRQPERRSSSKGSSSSKREAPKKEEVKEEVLPDIPDDQVEVPDNLMDNVEKLRQRKDVERNVADEDIDKLVVFSFNGKGYDCLTCGFMLLKDTAFKNHLMSKSHVMNVIDARSDKKYSKTRELLDIDLTPDGWYEKSEAAKKALIKQAKLMMKIDMEKKKRELENYNRDPSNFFSVNMASKKSATMTGDVVRITSIVESTIDVKEFSKDRFFGCEFVKSVASFQCRLCDIKIHNASEVLPHIDSRVHRNKYQMHLKRVPDYETKQREQNIELGGILREYEGQPVLLSETSTNTSEASSGQGKTLLEEIDTILVRVPEILNPPVKEEVKEKEEKTDKSEKAEEDESSKKDDEKTEKQGEEVENEKKDESKEEGEPMDTSEPKNTTEEHQTEETESKGAEAEVKEEEETAVKQEEKADEATVVKSDTKEETADENKETVEQTTDKAQIEDTPKKEEVVSPAATEAKPKRSAKKGTAIRGRGTAKRGTPKRTRGGRAAASPKVTPTETPTPEKPENEGSEEKTEADNDGSFMDGFQIVDEVQED